MDLNYLLTAINNNKNNFFTDNINLCTGNYNRPNNFYNFANTTWAQTTVY